MKRIWLFRFFMTAWGLLAVEVTPQSWNEYLAVARQISAGDAGTAISACEKLLPDNKLAIATLYLIYSRGYYNTPIDYNKAVEYLAMLYPGKFYNEEFKIWQSARGTPDASVDCIVLATPDEVNDSNTLPLTGKYLLRTCYEEENKSFFGLVPRVLKSINPATWPDTIPFTEYTQTLGNMGVMERQFSYKSLLNFCPEQERSLVLAAADAGYVPAMLVVSSHMLNETSGFKPDIAKVRNYLNLTIEKCNSYAKLGCKHAEADLALAEQLRRLLPNLTKSTAELLTFMAENRGNMAVYNECIAEITMRNDHPSCKFYKAMLLPKTQEPQALALYCEAAEQGSVEAIRYLMNNYDSWYGYYWAGIYKLPAKNNSNFFQIAFDKLQNSASGADYRMEMVIPPGSNFKTNLVLLASQYPLAQKFYEEEFGDEEKMAKLITFSVRLPEYASAEWVERSLHKMVKITVKPCSQSNYIDFFIQNDNPDQKCDIEILGDNNENMNDMWGRVLYADGSTKDVNCYNKITRKTVKRFRFNFASVDRDITFYIQVKL